MCTQTQDKYKRIELSLEAKHFITRLEQQLRNAKDEASVLEQQRDEAGRRYVAALGDLHEAQRVIAEAVERENARAENRPMANGEYPHIGICSGDYRKPLGSPGCVCDNRYKLARARIAELEGELAKVKTECESKIRSQELAQAEVDKVTKKIIADNSRLRAALKETEELALRYYEESGLGEEFRLIADIARRHLESK